MKFLFISVGTRGDIEPHLALAEMLIERGHDVVCAFPEQFRILTEESGIDFHSLGSEFLELLYGDVGKKFMGGSTWEKTRALFNILKKSFPVQRVLVRRQAEIVKQVMPDRIIHNGKAIYSFLWYLENPEKVIQISPVPYLIHAAKDHPNIGYGNKNLGRNLNALTYKLGNAGIIQSIRMAAKWMGVKNKSTYRELKKMLLSQSFIFTISPTLVTHQKGWPKNVKTLGYQDRNKTLAWKPEGQLEEFLEKHEKVLMLTFGSMSNNHPEEKTRLFLEVLAKHQIPTIVNSSAGGLIQPQEFDDGLFYFVQHIPYDWIFPKVYAVIHHGGSGTTHLAALNAKPSLIIPHIMDQFVWNSIAYKNGLGPKGISINKISKNNLEPKILDLWENETYKTNAISVAKSMQAESFDTELERALVDFPFD